MRITITALLALWLLAGCVAPTALRKPISPVDFSKFKTVAYAVHDSPQTEYSDGADGRTYGKDTIELIGSLLGVKLASMGYRVVEASTPHDMSIDVLVTEVKPGSGAARFWVGFGAGRADTEFDASFTVDSAVLTAFHGGRSFTGMELNVSPFSGKSEISALAATRSVEQIEKFIRDGGVIVESKR